MAAFALLFGLAGSAKAGAEAADDVSLGLTEFKQGRFAEALREWAHASDAGDSRGALYIGVLYDTGQGVRQDYGKALDWYRRAAEAGSPVGAFNVGVLYDSGLGVAQDPTEAATWYGRAADAGFGRADYNLGLLYESGTGVERNRGKAIRLFEEALRHGVSAALLHLTHLGVRRAGPVGAGQKSPLMDFQQAQSVIASRSPAEAQQATSVFRQAAQQHNALAEYDLGYCYERGLGVPLDQAQALHWYQRATADAKDDTLKLVAKSGADYLQLQLRRETGR